MIRSNKNRDVRYLIVAADDFGRSSSVNTAVAESHDRGILTASSIMAGGEAFEEAVQLALKRSRLSVGLHVTLCDGKAVLRRSQIPDLVDRDGCFASGPSRAWINYMRPAVMPQIEAEVKAQFDRLERAGIHPTHIDGHHHLQMHPFIFRILCREASRRGIGWIRLPCEPLPLVFSWRSLSRGIMPFLERAVFGVLRAYNLKTAAEFGISVAGSCLGLSWTGSIDKMSLPCLLSYAGGQVNEIFSHPDVCTAEGRRELEALTSADVRERLSSVGLELVGYRELTKERTALDSAWEGI
jgi:hopanoid biosynthesis associated protein HpnK